MTIIEGPPTEVYADEGMTLTDGETCSTYLCLGVWDSPDRWREVPDEGIGEEAT